MLLFSLKECRGHEKADVGAHLTLNCRNLFEYFANFFMEVIRAISASILSQRGPNLDPRPNYKKNT